LISIKPPMASRLTRRPYTAADVKLLKQHS
jgi:hypothetical protein